MVLPLTAILAVVAAVADTTPRPQLRAVRISEPVAIDGRLDDAAWRGGALITTLVQSSPTEGAPASEATAVHLAYDDAAEQPRPGVARHAGDRRRLDHDVDGPDEAGDHDRPAAGDPHPRDEQQG